MTGHVVLERRSKWTAVAAEQLVVAEVHTQVIPELDLSTTRTDNQTL